MSMPIGGTTPTPLTPEARAASDEARLKKSAKQLEGVFVEQLFKAMRDTVPQDEGAVGAGTGEDMFTGLMDQKLAAETPTQWAHGLADAAYRQLRKALPQAAEAGQGGNALARPDTSPKAAPAMKLTPSSAAMPLRPQPAISLTSVASDVEPR
jgi:peptidoglycan hydrolase FlgJ